MKALTLLSVSQLALMEGIAMGFNAVGVERFCDPEDFHLRTMLVFGEQQEMRKPRLRTPCEWALSYSEEDLCSRKPKQVEIPAELLDQSADAIRYWIAGQLLELA